LIAPGENHGLQACEAVKICRSSNNGGRGSGGDGDGKQAVKIVPDKEVDFLFLRERCRVGKTRKRREPHAKVKA
jgi:hypothetical protein